MTEQNEADYQANVNKDLSIADYEEQEAEREALIDTPIEMEMFQWNPAARETFPEMNKDRVGANLSEEEMFTISMNENLWSSIIAHRSSVKANLPYKESDRDLVANYFFPDSLIEATNRRISSTLTLSLSKEGFWRKLSRTRTIQKGFSYEETQKQESNLNWMFWKKKKKSNQQTNY